jgi:hypothetical protein
VSVSAVAAADGAFRRRQHQRIERTIRRWHRHGNARHTGSARRQRIHQHRRRISRLAAGDIKANRIHRPPAQPKRKTSIVAHHQILRQLRAVEGFDPLRRQVQCGAEFWRNGRIRRLNLGLCDAQSGGTGGLPAIKPRGVVQQRRIAARADIGDDAGNDAIHLLRSFARVIQ